MSTFDNPFDPKRRNRGCSCGSHASQAEHDAATSAATAQFVAQSDEAQRLKRVVEAGLLRAVIPNPIQRRAFLHAVGATTAAAALAHIFPLATATEVLAQGTGALEKKNLKVGFIPITCATPIIMAKPMGFYAKQGIDVEIVKTAGWAVVRDKTINKEYDAAHMLTPIDRKSVV